MEVLMSWEWDVIRKQSTNDNLSHTNTIDISQKKEILLYK